VLPISQRNERRPARPREIVAALFPDIDYDGASMNNATPHPRAAALLPKGTDVEVRARFDGRWVSGFDIASADRGHYQLRRQMDDVVVPADFAAGDIRRRT
jgi:hypothetical protein